MKRTLRSDSLKITDMASDTKCPSDVNPQLWEIINTTNRNTTAMCAKLDLLENKFSELDSKGKERDNEIKELRQAVNVLSARLGRSDIEQRSLRQDLHELQSHSMKENLIFNFDRNTSVCREIRGEDCASVIRVFLGEHMNVPDSGRLCIPVAHRLGSYKRGVTRPIIAKFPFANQLQNVLQHTKMLDASNRRQNTRHYVTRQTPAGINERKQLALPTFKDLKENPDNNARLVKDKLYVKGALQTQFVEATLPDVKPNDVLEYPIEESDPVSDSGSTFQGYATRVSSLRDISIARQQLLLRDGVATANHIITAFRIDDGNSIQENFFSDRDYGVGLELLKNMKENDNVNIVLFATRKCPPGFKHIGNKRFDHVKQVCSQALERLTSE